MHSILSEALVSPDSAFMNIPIKALREQAYMAHEFVFDEEASRHAGQFIGENERLIYESLQFAIPPFPVTYVQFHISECLKVIDTFYPGAQERRQAHKIKYGWTDGNADRAVGYLITPHSMWSCCVGVKEEDKACFLPLHYRFGVGRTPRGTVRFDRPEREDWWLGSLAMGSGMLSLINLDELNDLLHRFRAQSTVTGIWENEMLFRSAAGELRFMWSLLLLLNQRHHFTSTFVEPRRAFYRGKHIGYRAHNVVTINLKGMKAARKAIARYERASPVLHDVRGHFYHYHTVTGCAHAWPPVPTEYAGGDPNSPRWQCAACKGWRSWRKAHQRGNAEIGVATHNYAVTSEEVTRGH